MVDPAAAEAKSRIAAIRLLSMTLRLMENWRRMDDDHDCAMILVAVAVINFEKLTRGKLPHELEDIRNVVPSNLLTMCNISSIALATGLNRETARRKVLHLVELGLLVRRSDGCVQFSQDYGDRNESVTLLRAQLETFARTANDLLRDGSLVLHHDETVDPSGKRGDQICIGLSALGAALALVCEPVGAISIQQALHEVPVQNGPNAKAEQMLSYQSSGLHKRDTIVSDRRDRQ